MVTLANKLLAVCLNASIPFFGVLSFDWLAQPKSRHIALFGLCSVLVLFVGQNDLVLGRYHVSGLTTPVTVILTIGFIWSVIITVGSKQLGPFNVRRCAVGAAIAFFITLVYWQAPHSSRVLANSLAPFIEAQDVITYRTPATEKVGGLRLTRNVPSSPSALTLGFSIAGVGDVVAQAGGVPVICSPQQAAWACREFSTVCQFLKNETTTVHQNIDIAFEVQSGQLIIVTAPPFEEMGSADGLIRSLGFALRDYEDVFTVHRVFRSGTVFSSGEIVQPSGCPDVPFEQPS
ncbi:MAG: hypothetical protein AAF739_14970 [Pseudomonadota bacterium]